MACSEKPSRYKFYGLTKSQAIDTKPGKTIEGGWRITRNMSGKDRLHKGIACIDSTLAKNCIPCFSFIDPWAA
jgi:hypothetical protein